MATSIDQTAIVSATPGITDAGGSRHAPGGDTLFRLLSLSAALVIMAAVIGFVVSLVSGGWLAISHFGAGFLATSTWDPVAGVYGAAGPVVGTLITSAVALMLAWPIAIGISVFLVEICPDAVARWLAIAVELLAGIPSIVYGMWGLFVLAPWFAANVQMPLMMAVTPGSWLDTITQGVPNGANIFTASLVLAVMILPFIAAMLRELLLSVPSHMREAAYGLGCTKREVVMRIMLPFVRKGVVGAAMLGLGRALGETMAVTFIIGNSHDFPNSLFASGSTLSSTVANEFTEATDDLHVSALIALGLVLFIITFVPIIAGRLLIRSSESK